MTPRHLFRVCGQHTHGKNPLRQIYFVEMERKTNCHPTSLKGRFNVLGIHTFWVGRYNTSLLWFNMLVRSSASPSLPLQSWERFLQIQKPTASDSSKPARWMFFQSCNKGLTKRCLIGLANNFA